MIYLKKLSLILKERKKKKKTLYYEIVIEQLEQARIQQNNRSEPKFRSVSVALVKKKLQFEYEEDLTTIHNKCGIKVVNQAQQMNNQVQPQQKNLSEYEKQKQQVNEIFKSLYTSHQEKRVNIQKLVSSRPIRNKPIDWNEVKRRLPKDQIGTIYDPTRFQNLYEKFNREIEINAPHGPFISFRQFLIERRGISFKD
ncbi:unnamed protein product [Paramecium sonneborni]|uniref:Uncharacterized protein n=1 Tax=Paramecium sonneborni TaxID=65129 RepID=A0A8S1L9H4_9CILI|nr:unnamed protein product [Paramecium sonneborni]